MPKIKIQDKPIGLRLTQGLYEKLLKLALAQSAMEKRNVGVSEVIRKILEKNI